MLKGFQVSLSFNSYIHVWLNRVKQNFRFQGRNAQKKTKQVEDSSMIYWWNTKDEEKVWGVVGLVIKWAINVQQIATKIK